MDSLHGSTDEGQFIANLEGREPGRLAQMKPDEVIGQSCTINTDDKCHIIIH